MNAQNSVVECGFSLAHRIKTKARTRLHVKINVLTRSIQAIKKCGVGKCNFFHCNCDGGCRKGNRQCTDDQLRKCGYW
uniref:Uncharacterized protein n=1 Tax=Romanomermis culicivorax TaxID=13658 RepID=A0A915IV88_ROMCU